MVSGTTRGQNLIFVRLRWTFVLDGIILQKQMNKFARF